jgi:glycerol-3-phosphate dehydrogenase (NAD(P)+)
MHVGIIGLGNMGTAVGNMIANNGYEVLGWNFEEEVVAEINGNRTNEQYLPGITLHSSLRATKDLATVVGECDVVFISIPSVFIQGTLSSVEAAIDRDLVLVNMAKGIRRDTGLTSFQTLTAMFPDNPRIMLSGPSIANEFARKMPTVVVLAGQTPYHLLQVSRMLDNGYFRTRFSSDEIGVELGGILKNIYAIGLGLFDGKKIESINFRSVYLTIAQEEIAKIGVGMGARIETFLYLSGMGDLLATSLSEHSHNRHMGELLASGFTRDQIEESMGVLPEGYNTLQAVLYIAEKLHIPIPLAKGLWDVINGRDQAEHFIYSFIKDFVD